MNNLHSEIDQAFIALKKAVDDYWPISVETWQKFKLCCEFKKVDKGAILYGIGEVPQSFAFVYSGLFRLFILDEKGHEYNKMFFDEKSFPGSMSALLKNTPSLFSIDALEPSKIITINFSAYRRLLMEKEDLKIYHILYLEKNWLLAKDAREVEIVQEDASERYLRFLNDQASIAARIPQYHLASHLGITPTQLSRIRKTLSDD